MFISRPYFEEQIQNSLKSVPITILMGARQVGKTTLMQSLELTGSNVFIIGQDPEIGEIFSKISIIESYLKRGFGENPEGVLLIDEFQFIPEIGTTLKILADKFPGMRFLCSGSSSLEMMNKINESMAGRVRIIPVLPLSFEEYIRFKDPELFEKLKEYQVNDPIQLIEKRIPLFFKEYLLYGGLPKITLCNSYNEKKDLLYDIYQTYLLKDIRSFVRNQDFIGFNRLLKLMANQTGNLLNYNNLSISSGLSYRKCEEYSDLLRQMYIIKLLAPWGSNKTSEITKMKKVFFYDNGIRNIVYNNFSDPDFRLDGGSLFENFVFNEICRISGRYENIFYYRAKSGLEVDFIVSKGNEVIPIEAKYSDFNNGKNIQGLTAFGKRYPFSKSILVNKNLGMQFGNIHFVPGYFISKLNFY